MGKKYLLQYASGHGDRLSAVTYGRHAEYAKLNGYELVVAKGRKTGLLPHWERYQIVLDMWENEPDAVIVWVDIDAVIATNEEILDSVPADRSLCLLRDPWQIWRTGVMVIRYSDTLKTIFKEVIEKGPVYPKEAPFDDECRLNMILQGGGYRPYPLQARWNQIVRCVPSAVPIGNPEISIAALHGGADLIKLAFLTSWTRDWKRYNYKESEDGSPDPKEICWYIRCGKATSDCDRALKYLRDSYPTSQVQLVDDGTGDPVFDQLASKHNVTLYRAPQEYNYLISGKMWNNQLIRYLQNSSCSWLVKIDTDTLILRQLRRKFPAKNMFGSRLATINLPEFIHGMFAGIPRALVEKTVNSGILLTEKYNNAGWKRVNPRGDAYPSEDRVISEAVKEATGTKLLDYAEVGNAVIHPVKG